MFKSTESHFQGHGQVPNLKGTTWGILGSHKS